MPKVVGYPILGIIIGLELFNFIPLSFEESSHFVIDLALALIAVMIGGSLKYSTLKKRGAEILSITFFQASFYSQACSIFRPLIHLLLLFYLEDWV